MIIASFTAVLLVAAPTGEHRFDAEIARAIASTSDVFPVSPALVRAIIRQESSGALNRSSQRFV